MELEPEKCFPFEPSFSCVNSGDRDMLIRLARGACSLRTSQEASFGSGFLLELGLARSRPLSSGLTAERSAPWERGCGVEAGAAPLRLPPRVGGSGLSPGGQEVQARAGGCGEEDAQQTASPGDTMASPAQERAASALMGRPRGEDPCGSRSCPPAGFWRPGL